MEEIDCIYDSRVYSLEHGYESFEEYLSYLFEENDLGYGWLVTADLGFWNGRGAGGKIYSSGNHWKMLCDIADGQYVIRAFKNGKNLEIETTHHDNSNLYLIRGITKKGKDFIESHRYMPAWEIHHNLSEKKGLLYSLWTKRRGMRDMTA